MRKLSLFIALLVTAICEAQESTSDCLGATVLCGDIYSEENAPPGTGDFYEYTGPCNQNLETMSLWYTFTVYEAGDLSFILTPNNLADDYDWGLFNITTGGCAGISANGPSPTVSCNSWGSLVQANGATGISTANGGVSNVGGPGDQFGPPFNANLPVSVGQTYALVVMNWSNSTDGYTIDFGESSASLYDQEPPTPVALTKDCNNGQFLVTFSELVVSATAEYLDFNISGPQGSFDISNVLPLNSFSTLEDQFILSPAVNITTAGTYTLSITNASGSIADPCGNLSVGSITIEIAETISYQTSTTIACNGIGGSIEITGAQGGTGNLDFYLNNVLQPELLVENISSGNYVVSLIDDVNCFVNTQVSIPDQNITVEIPQQDTLSCALPEIEIVDVLVSPAQNVSYFWEILTPDGFQSIGNATINPTIADTGVYQLTITNTDNGCAAQSSVEIFASELNNMAFDALVNNSCNGAGGSIELQNISGGNQIYTIELDGVEQSSELILDLAPGDYLVSVHDGNNCSVAYEVVIPDSEINVSIPLQDIFTCSVNTITIEGVSISPQQDVTFEWFQFFEDGSVPTGDVNISPTFTTAGTYILTISNESSGCEASASILLDSNIPETFSFEYDVIDACNGLYGVIEVTEVNGGVGPYSLLLDNVLQSDYLMDELNDGNYTLTILDQDLCESVVEVNVPDHILTVNIPDQELLTCDIPTITIEDLQIAPSQTVIYEWLYYDPLQGYVSINQAIPNPQVSIPGIYRLVVTTPDGGCENADAIEIFYSDENNISFNPLIHTACNGLNGSLVISDLTGGTEPYVFTLDEIFQSDLSVEGLENGNYLIQITDGHDCITTMSVVIPDNLLSIEIPDQDKITCSRPSVEIGGVAIIPDQQVIYSWAYESNAQFITFLSGDETPIVSSIGNYQLTVTNSENGCSTSEVFPVEAGDLVAVDLSHIRFPNIFTPNQDSKNEDWVPFLDYDAQFNLIDAFDLYELKVYNRWGNLIFDSSESNSKRWSVKDEEDGTYFYTVKYRTTCGGLQEGSHQGNVQILR